jgi:hypothetical protein
MDLRTLQAHWELGIIAPEKVPDAATELLVQGVESPAVIELAGLHVPTYWQVLPVFERLVEEHALGPIPRDNALWRLAYATAHQITSGAISPLEGATRLWRICTDLGMPDALTYFVYLAADYGEGPGDRATEEAWFDARIREHAADLRAGMPEDGESPPRVTA